MSSVFKSSGKSSGDRARASNASSRAYVATGRPLPAIVWFLLTVALLLSVSPSLFAQPLPPGIAILGPYDIETHGAWNSRGAVLELTVKHLTLAADLSRLKQLLGASGAGHQPTGPDGDKSDSLRKGKTILRRIVVRDSKIKFAQSKSETEIGFEADLETNSQGLVTGTISIKGDALNARMTVIQDGASGKWAAHIDHAEIQLALLVDVIRGFSPDSVADLQASGKLIISGEVGHDSATSLGKVELSLSGGSFRQPSNDFEVSDVTLEAVATGDLMSPGSLKAKFSTGSGHVGAVKIKTFVAHAMTSKAGEITVDADVGALGGKISLEPSLVKLDDMRPQIVLTIEGVDAAQVLPLFPSAKTTGTGQLDGRIPLLVTSGIPKFGEGKLQLRAGQTSKVIFDRPGLFTQAIPTWLPIRGLLKDVEEGRRPFNAYEMVVILHPDGPTAERSAALHLVGKPDRAIIPWRLTLDTDINGPLEQVMSLGLNKNVHLEMK